jgi:hypothetical protein
LSGADGVADRFIVHIGDIANVEGFGAAGFEGAAQDVLEDEGAEVSDVSRAIDSGAAAVEAEGGTIHGNEFPLAAGEGVEEAHAGGLIGGSAGLAKSEGWVW